MVGHEKEKMLKLLDRGADVTILQHGLSASLWTQVCRAMPVGSNQELIGKKISDTRDGMIVNYGGVIQLTLPYSNLTCQAIHTLDKLAPNPQDDFKEFVNENTKRIADTFGNPSVMIYDHT